MKVFHIRLAAVLLMVFAVVAGPLVGTAAAAGKVALVIDVCLLYTSPSPRD